MQQSECFAPWRTFLTSTSHLLFLGLLADGTTAGAVGDTGRGSHGEI